MNQSSSRRARQASRTAIAVSVVLLTLFSFVSCIAKSSDESVAIPNEEGGALLAEATRAAMRAIGERKTATIQAATMQAQGTSDAGARRATATAQALWSKQQEDAANATAAALSIQQSQTRQAATDTAEAQIMLLSQSRTANAVQATETSNAATSTRSAQEIQAALETHQATATTEALEIRRTQAAADAARFQAWADFFDTILKLILGLGSIALAVMLIIQLARYLDAIAMRQKLVETRSGTVLIVASRGHYSAQLVNASTPLLDEGDPFTTQAPIVDAEASGLLKVTTTRGENWIAKTDPEEELREQRRRLAMRLLRESMRYYSVQRMDPRTINRLPSFRDLEWSSETWVRAVNTLKPYIITKQGRGGGTYCSADFPTLVQLYNAVGERRIVLNGSSGANHSPTESPVTR